MWGGEWPYDEAAGRRLPAPGAEEVLVLDLGSSWPVLGRWVAVVRGSA